MTADPDSAIARTVLDGPKIRQARLAANVTEKQVIVAVGINFTALRAIESANGNRRHAATLTLTQLRALADAIGVHVTDLFKPAAEGMPSEPDDARALGALLTNTPPARQEALADALGWDLDRLAQAADGLALLLPATGMRLHRTHEAKYGIVSATNGTAPAEVALVQRSLDTRSLYLNEAITLKAVTDGKLTPRLLTSNACRAAYGALLKHGLIEDHARVIRLTDAVAHALDF